MEQCHKVTWGDKDTCLDNKFLLIFAESFLSSISVSSLLFYICNVSFYSFFCNICNIGLLFISDWHLHFVLSSSVHHSVNYVKTKENAGNNAKTSF